MMVRTSSKPFVVIAVVAELTSHCTRIHLTSSAMHEMLRHKKQNKDPFVTLTGRTVCLFADRDPICKQDWN